MVSASAQTIRVTGTVHSSQDNHPIAGAQVVVAGTNIGTVTNPDGAFALNVPDGATTLVVSFFGMEQAEVAVASVVNVVMDPQIQSMDEIVVVGYGTQRKEDVTSSISQIKGSALSDKASPSFMQQMAGRAAGVQVISSSGDVTMAPKIIIRGVGTISSGSGPLYVVNGSPMTSGNIGYAYSNNNALADINPADIESVEILKDGAATAIYGSRAANGVVLITTKQGRQAAGQQTANVSYDGWVGLSQASKLYELLNAEQFVEIANEKYTNIGGQPQAAMDDKGTNTNWLDHVYRTGIQHSHTISVSGATPRSNYYLSGGYTNQQGIVINNQYNRYTFNGNVSHKIFRDVITVGFSLNASSQDNKGPVKGHNSLSDNMYAATKMLPNVAVYNPEHPTGFNVDFTDPKALGRGANKRPIDLTIPNIVWVLKNNKQLNTSYRLMPTADLGIKFAEWLNFKTIIGADVSLYNEKYSWRPESGDGYGYKGLVNVTNATRKRWNYQNILTFNKNFGLHHIDATAVGEWTNYVYSRTTADVRDFSDPFFVDEIISSTYSTQSVGGSWSTNGLASYVFRANYNYNSLVYLGGSVRRDGLSVLHPDNRWGTFYGASAALRISNFNFWKNSGLGRVINDFRLRGSIAEVGNDRLSGDFMYIDHFMGEKYGDQVGIAYNTVGNKSLKWETQQITDFGFDASLLNGRLNLVFAYWQKDNNDIVLDVPTPPSMGVPKNKIAQNYGQIKNNGIELEVTAYPVQARNFTWRTSLNFSTQQSIVKELVNDIPYEHHILREGESFNSLWGYVYEGVNMANGNPMYRKADGTIIHGNPNDSKYYVYDPAKPEDMSKVSSLTTDDKKILGKTIPTWFGGWDNTLTWKNFDMNIFIRFSGGNKVANVTRRDLLNQQFLNNSTEILGRWQSKEKPGDGKTPKLYSGKATFLNLDNDGSSRWVEDGKFLKLQNLSIGYNVPASVCQSLLVQRLRVYVQGQNLFMFTPYSGLDPESYSTTYLVSGGVAGIDWNGNPQQRSFLVGISVGF
jgi:TonB-linked SusC/RagA family outer membrane protein